MKFFYLFFLFFFTKEVFSQETKEVPTPYYIKTAYFTQGSQALIPIFKLNDRFSFVFDDLMGEESDYYYQIKHFNKDWTPSPLLKSEYINGMDNIRIVDYGNSFNTLQTYSRYILNFPNSRTKLLVSGNYMLEILNQDQEVIFSRKFILYEEQISVGVEIKKTRSFSTSDTKQNVQMTLDYGNHNYFNPKENFKILILQNGRWDNAIKDVAPQYSIGTQFTYQYDKETQFFGGNEYLFIDNSDIRQVNNYIQSITSDNGIFSSYLYPSIPRGGDKKYTFFQDIDGSFLPRNKYRDNAAIEADYAWVYFKLQQEELKGKKIYVLGMFNNYQLTDENELKYNSATRQYEGALLIKQGFTNYMYAVVNNGKIEDQNAIDGNFYETENTYTVLIYYRGNIDRYDRVIGFGEAKSINITN